MSTEIHLSDAEKGRLEAALEAINQHADGTLPRHLDAALENVALRTTLTLLAGQPLANELHRRALMARQVAEILESVAKACESAARPCVSQNVRDAVFEEIADALGVRPETEGPR